MIASRQFLKLVRLAGAKARLASALPAARDVVAGLSRQHARLRRDERGVAAIEFGFIAPIMLLLLIGIVDISNAISLNWRMVNLNKTLADLPSQSASLTTAQIDNIFLASAAVLSPYKGVMPRMTVSSVVVGNDNIARVCWSQRREDQDGLPGTPTLKVTAGLVKGTVVPLPNLAMAVPKQTYIVATTTMEFDGILSPSFPLSSKTLYFRTRAGKRDGSLPEQVELVGQPLCDVP